jgi:GT2 family glycosyltransferase
MRREMSAHPAVSVVIASRDAVTTIGETLASLEGQAASQRCEIIVVDSSTDGTAALVREHFPGTRLLEFSSRKFCGEARNIGIRAARGPIIAMTDADCRVGPSWLENIIRAHEGSYPVVGGAIACGNPESYVGWGAYFTEFSTWQPAGPARFTADMAGANVSYRKEVFQTHGSFIEGTYCSDTEFHWRLAGEGHRIRFDPSIVVYHRNIDRLGRFLRHEFFHGRSFAVVRCQAKAFSFARRAVYALLSPLIFLKLLTCNAVKSIPFGPYPASYLKALPVTTLGILCWTAGEAAGYVRGSGTREEA